LLERIVAERLLTVRGVYGFWSAHSVGDDIVIGEPSLTFNMLRQQERQPDGMPNLSLADFIAPRDRELDDYIGAFAITAGIGTDALVAAFERGHDDYHAIMVKALADRLAEASAEWLHAQARAEWGYGVGERLSNDDLIAERYRGIRPAFGYPACPDHSEKYKLFDLLEAGRAGMSLTESCAMAPAASVSGLYFAHARARYFTVGRIGRDQVESYAQRKGIDVDEAERWLRPNLGYD
jgi:5-methyltetrahydrofolate--homocysteine methyltransferase